MYGATVRGIPSIGRLWFISPTHAIGALLLVGGGPFVIVPTAQPCHARRVQPVRGSHK